MTIAEELDAIGRSAPDSAWDDVPPSDATAASLWADVRRLRGFATAIMEACPTGAGLDFGEAQDLAVKFGLLRLKDPAPTKPCMEEGCACAEYYGLDFNGDFDDEVQCYERTPLLLGHNVCYIRQTRK